MTAGPLTGLAAAATAVLACAAVSLAPGSAPSAVFLAGGVGGLSAGAFLAALLAALLAGPFFAAAFFAGLS